MLRALPLADGSILPQAKQESYFFNRIGQQRSFRCVWFFDSERLVYPDASSDRQVMALHKDFSQGC